jgi:AraC-like DNA-binding protein
MFGAADRAVTGMPSALPMPFLRKFIAPQAPPVVGGCDGALDVASIGALRIGRFASAQPCELHHPLSLSSTGRSYVTIFLQRSGRSVFEQNGRQMRLSAGSWGLLDAPRPCKATHLEAVEQLHFLIPREQVRLGIDVRFAMNRAFPGESRVSSLMCHAIGSLLDELPALAPRRAEELAEVAVRLFHLAVLERIEQPRCPTQPEDTRDRITSYVQNHLRDPRLSLDQMATDLSCSKRYLHMAFSDHDCTLNEYIWTQRLEHCRRDLQSASHADRSITDIAMSWGFSNLSHFSHAFRERFGQSPRAVRTAAAKI